MSEQQQQQQSQYPPMFLELEVNALKAYLVIQLEPMYVISSPSIHCMHTKEGVPSETHSQQRTTTPYIH